MLDKYKYISSNGYCDCNGVKWLIDKRNCLYQSSENEQFILKANLCCDYKHREFHFRETGLFPYKHYLICIPHGGNFIPVYNTKTDDLFKIKINEENSSISVFKLIVYNNYIFIFSVNSRNLYRLNLETLICNEEKEFSECIKKYDCNTPFLAKSVIQDSEKVYLGINGSNKVIEYNLISKCAKINYELPCEFDISYMFYDNKKRFWFSDQSTFELAVFDGLRFEKKQWNELGIKSPLRKAFFDDHYGFFLPEYGDYLVVYNIVNDKFDYIKIKTDISDEIASKLRFYLISLDISKDKLTVWLGEKGRVEIDRGTWQQKYYQMKKSEDNISALEIIKLEENCNNKFEIPMWFINDKSYPLEWFISVI